MNILHNCLDPTAPPPFSTVLISTDP
jgi:hypothetical protein